jgi:hypothetical protein
MERLFVDGSLVYDNPCRDAPARPHSRPNRDSKTATRGRRPWHAGFSRLAARRGARADRPGRSTACSPRTRRSVPESPPTGGWWRGERCPRVVMGQRIYPTWKQRATGHREDCNGKMAMTGRMAWRDLCIRASREGGNELVASDRTSAVRAGSPAAAPTVHTPPAKPAPGTGRYAAPGVETEKPARPIPAAIELDSLSKSNAELNEALARLQRGC